VAFDVDTSARARADLEGSAKVLKSITNSTTCGDEADSGGGMGAYGPPGFANTHPLPASHALESRPLTRLA